MPNGDDSVSLGWCVKCKEHTKIKQDYDAACDSWYWTCLTCGNVEYEIKAESAALRRVRDALQRQIPQETE